MKAISKKVLALSCVSLLTDMASEMLYPVMPLFLKHIGYTAIFIGLLEGFAEAVAGLSKGYFGWQSDVLGRRLPFVRIGYSLSAVSKPMLAFFTNSWWIFSARFMDRLGKGVRTGARDAILSDESSKATRGEVFGFHRSMDTFGAVLGPAFSLIYLNYNPEDYKTLFLIAFVPGVFAVLLTFLMREKKRLPKPSAPKKPGIFAFVSYWAVAPADYKRITTGFLLFALFNSSDVFLLLRMKEAGLTDTQVIGVYIFYNLVFAVLAYPLGRLADKLGLKKVYISGLLIYALVYVGFALNEDLYTFLLLFAMYGMFAAATEGVAKAWISNVVVSHDTATAIGTYSGYQSVAALFASSLCGLLWYLFGSTVTFFLTATMAVVALVYLSQVKHTLARDQG